MARRWDNNEWQNKSEVADSMLIGSFFTADNRTFTEPPVQRTPFRQMPWNNALFEGNIKVKRRRDFETQINQTKKQCSANEE